MVNSGISVNVLRDTINAELKNKAGKYPPELFLFMAPQVEILTHLLLNEQ